MKAVTVAAAAVLLGAASAQDSAWNQWTSSEDPKTTPEAKTTTPEAETSTWSEWSTSKTPEPETTSTWSEWSTTSSKPVEYTSTTSASWSEWSTTSSKPVEYTSTTSASWSEWSTTSSEPNKYTSTTSASWSEWSTTSSKPSKETTTSSATWSEWQSTSTPVEPTSSETWSEWVTGTTTITSTSTQWNTVTVYAKESDKAASTGTWSEWSSSSTPVAASSSWSSWGAASTDANGCKMEVSVSYGAPVWNPTASIVANATGTWADWSSSTPAAASSTGTWSEWSSSSPAAASSTSTWAEWSSTPAAATTTASQTWATWSSSASASATAYNKGASNGGNYGISANGDKFGMTYSPYTADSQCKDQGTVKADIAKMASLGFSSVRVYSTDCSTLEYVGAACKEHNMKMILGVFISKTGISGAQPQVDAIVAWAQWDLVDLIVVGNEAVFNGYCSASELGGFISSCKQAFKAAGFNGAVSTTDELSVWQNQGSAWCDAVDVVTANLYAFFNPNTAAEDAGSFIQAQIQELSQICPGKDVYVMESGWPSAGSCNGKACPSPENQATAIKGIQSAVGAKIVYFSYEDEQWKEGGKFGVEQHWGCADVFSNSWSSY